MLNKAVFLWLICIIEISDQYGSIGPADIMVESIEECENPSIYKDPYTISLAKINRTHAGASACYNFDAPMEPGIYTFNLTSAQWGDGGWKPNTFHYFSSDVCNDLMDKAKSIWVSILDGLGIEPKCPVPKGTFCTENYIAPQNGVFPSMLYGKFRVDIILNSLEKPLLCFRVYVDSVRAKNFKM